MMNKELTKDYLRTKILGCWLGKAAGGTLGQPYEGCTGPMNLDYYYPVPTDMIPNDDLDLQVLWAQVLDKMDKPVISRNIFAQAWVDHVDFPWDEYGVALRNLRLGIPAGVSGAYDNYFVNGLGAAIRSEIWACLAPGNPELAAKYAYEDACVDHSGDGIYAEQYLAALQSLAFIDNDIMALIKMALDFIPRDCQIAAVILDTLNWCETDKDWLNIRNKVLEKYGSDNFTDCIMNMGFTIISLILSKGDFSKAICIAVNCGYDADCTGATVGAIMGLIDPASIDEKWLKPIGRKLIINKGIVGITHPDDLDGFTDQIINLGTRVTLGQEEAQSSNISREINTECGVFSPWFAMDSNKFSPCLPPQTQMRKFSGNLCKISTEGLASDSLYMMKFTIQMPETKKVRIMFNTPSISRVWLDNNFIFGRDGGMMSPSFHRAPISQFYDLELTAGTHELMAGVAKKCCEAEIRFVVGVGEHRNMQWLDVIK